MPLRKKAGIPIPATAPPSPERELNRAPVAVGPQTLPVPFVRQTQDQWCWAACTEMVATYLGVTGVTQCALANFLHGQTKCCQSPSSPQCNKPCPLGAAVRVFAHVKIKALEVNAAATVATLVREINQQRPVEAGYFWFGGGGHVAIVYGYTADGLFDVHDPWFGTGRISYFDLVTAYGRGRWGVSYGGFRRV